MYRIDVYWIKRNIVCSAGHRTNFHSPGFHCWIWRICRRIAKFLVLWWIRSNWHSWNTAKIWVLEAYLILFLNLSGLLYNGWGRLNLCWSFDWPRKSRIILILFLKLRRFLQERFLFDCLMWRIFQKFWHLPSPLSKLGLYHHRSKLIFLWEGVWKGLWTSLFDRLRLNCWRWSLLKGLLCFCGHRLRLPSESGWALLKISCHSLYMIRILKRLMRKLSWWLHTFLK